MPPSFREGGDLQEGIYKLEELIMLFTTSIAEPVAFPDRFHARYTVHAGGFEVGTTTVSLAPVSDGHFEYVTYSRATGVAALLGFEEIRERKRSVSAASG
jgi:hypothetical protein